MNIPTHPHQEPAEVGDAKAEVAEAMSSRIADLRDLMDCIDAQPQYDQEALSRLGVETDPADDPEAAREEAENRLYEYPLSVETATTFEIVLGTGGPDDRLVVECNVAEDDQYGFTHEIRRVVYRYSWTGSAEIELTGEDRRAAEDFARRVVPELAE